MAPQLVDFKLESYDVKSDSYTPTESGIERHIKVGIWE